MTSENFEILHIEDNEGDQFLTKQAFESSSLNPNISGAFSGDEGLDFLYKRNGFENAPTPHIILLDINMPGINGHEFLAEVKANEDLRHIPIIMFTSSEAEKDIIKSYQNYANAYVKKALDFTGFQECVKAIESFWFTANVFAEAS